MNFHGGNIYDYNRQDLIDFSSNINPLGIPRSFVKALTEQFAEFIRYPDINYTKLRKDIAEYLGVDSQSIIPGNGAVELIYKSIAAAGNHRVYGLCPTFSEYKKGAQTAGCEYTDIPAYGVENKEINLELLFDKVTTESTVVICNPNNPTGTLIPIDTMCQIAQRLKKLNCTLIADEAFMEFTEDYPKNSMQGFIDTFDNLIIVKAATKFFGMPGIRLGYGITGNIQLAHRIKESQEPWSINTAAIIAGGVIFKDCEYIQSSREWIRSERQYLFEKLREIEGIKVYKSQANFHLIKIEKNNLDAWQLRDRLLKHSILIRTPEGFFGLTDKHVRLAVKDREANDLLIGALGEEI